jgi:hypothetical protein
MPTPFRSALSLVLSLAPLGAGTPDFNPLLSIARETWPEKHHLAVVCNYAASKGAIEALAAAAAPGSRITVVDARSASRVDAALGILGQRKADFLVMVASDPVFFDGSFGATLLVNGMARQGVPSVGTRAVALRQGAVFAIGEGTGNQLLVTDRLRGTVSVIIPDAKVAALAPASTPADRGVSLEVVAVP